MNEMKFFSFFKFIFDYLIEQQNNKMNHEIKFKHLKNPSKIL